MRKKSKIDPSGRRNDMVMHRAIYRVMYSSVTGSSTLNLWLWHSTWARLIRMRASAVSPAKAITTWLSNRQIFRTVRSSCNLATDFFSTPRTTTLPPRTPTYRNQKENEIFSNSFVQLIFFPPDARISASIHHHDKHFFVRLVRFSSCDAPILRLCRQLLAYLLVLSSEKNWNFVRVHTAVDPLRTASWAYSTCNRWPSGEKMVTARSYLADMIIKFQNLLCNTKKYAKRSAIEIVCCGTRWDDNNMNECKRRRHHSMTFVASSSSGIARCSTASSPCKWEIP